MTKIEIAAQTKSMIALYVAQITLMGVAMVFAFREFPDHAWTIAVSLLFLSTLKQSALSVQACDNLLEARKDFIRHLTLQTGVVALSRGELEEHGSSNEFWSAMRGQVLEDLDFEDGVKEAGMEIDGHRRAGFIFNLAFIAVADLIILFGAKFLSGYAFK